MDPNVALAQLREALAELDKCNPATAKDAAFDAANAAEALDEWLSRGGFLPDAWRKD